jgi:hypothetical protein
VASLALASPAAAQTTDPVFSGWSWAPEGLGSRPAGLGGAFVAVADGVQAAYVNPAGLALIPLAEISLSSGRPWLGAGTGRRFVRVAAYGAQTGAQRLERSAAGGSLESSVWEAGLGVAVEPIPRVMIGGSLAWSRLRLEGQRPASGTEATGTTVGGEGGQLRFTGGVLLTLMGGQSRALPLLRLGFAYQPGFDWSTQVTGGTGAAGASVDVRRPTVMSLGLAYRPTDRWGLSAQGDVVRYREVVNTLRRNVGDGEGFRLPDAVEPRVGAEYGAPLWCGCGVFKVRAGLHYRSPGTLRYEGSDPTLGAAFGRRPWRTVAAAGVSFFSEYFDSAIRLDVDARDLFDGPDLSFGIVWRF